MPAISDSSPLILLARIGRFELLHDLFSEILIPPAVFDEVVSVNPTRVGALEVKLTPRIRICELPDPGLLLTISRLGLGESEVIALAQSVGEVDAVILDDYQARRTARQRNLPVVGSAGMVLLAKRRGLIFRVAPLLDELMGAGLRLGQREAHELLAAAGELPPAPHL